jgi:cytosine/adenosine deaminase-related metal-dependent hydrolase
VRVRVRVRVRIVRVCVGVSSDGPSISGGPLQPRGDGLKESGHRVAGDCQVRAGAGRIYIPCPVCAHQHILSQVWVPNQTWV